MNTLSDISYNDYDLNNGYSDKEIGNRHFINLTLDEIKELTGHIHLVKTTVVTIQERDPAPMYNWCKFNSNGFSIKVETNMNTFEFFVWFLFKEERDRFMFKLLFGEACVN